MIGLVRATVICATLALGLTAAGAADKAFKRDELADSAIKLEAQIKSEAGPVAKSAATLRTDADAAFRRTDFRAGLQILGQIVATAPEDSANWLRLAKTIFQIRSASSSEQTFLLERASTAAYIAYQRAGNAGRGGRCAGRAGPRDVASASCGVRRWMRCGCRSTCARSPRSAASTRSCATSTASGCWITPSIPMRASPRACFQFSEDLAKRVDFAPFVALAGTDKPALTSRGQAALRRRPEARRALQHQRCAPACRPPSRRRCRNRPSSTSMCATASRSCASPASAYVLPRTGQRGIPLVSVNTPAVKVNVFRIGDRNLINTVLGSDFQRDCRRYELDAISATSAASRSGPANSRSSTTLNADVTTAFPVDQALGDLQPGVYVMTAAAEGPGSATTMTARWRRNGSSSPTSA